MPRGLLVPAWAKFSCVGLAGSTGRSLRLIVACSLESPGGRRVISLDRRRCSAGACGQRNMRTRAAEGAVNGGLLDAHASGEVGEPQGSRTRIAQHARRSGEISGRGTGAQRRHVTIVQTNRIAVPPGCDGSERRFL